MWAIIIYLNDIWNGYPIEFILLIVSLPYSIFKFVDTHLPVKYKLSKRWYFWKKIEGATCQIKVSIKLRDSITLEQINTRLKPLWESGSFSDIRVANELNFNSTSSSSSYSIRVVEDNERNNSVFFVTLNNFGGLEISRFGNIKKLENTINEIQWIIDILNLERARPVDVITTEITITPKLKDRLNSKISAQYTHDNCSCRFNNTTISITNQGFPSIKENISKIIYDWMEHFI